MRVEMKSLVVGGVLAVLLGGGCASLDPRQKGYTFPVEFSRDIPAAKGKVNVEPEKDGSNKVKLEVEHVAPPQSVDPQATTYVVWLKPEGAPPQNAGVLRVGEDRKGSFETKTPFDRFDMTVTAERETTAAQPSERRMLRAAVQAPGGTL